MKRIYWFVAAIISLLISIWSGMDMLHLYQQDELWGYRPLTLLFWSYFTLSFFWNGLRNIEGQSLKIYLLATITGVLLGLSFPPLPFLILIIFGWALLIYISHDISNRGTGYQFRVFFHVFIIWNIIATYWISNTAFAAGIVAMFVNTLLMTVPLLLYGLTRKVLSPRFHFFILAACWISFEYFHFRWEAHWPWLALGHYFMDQPWMVQWYEWTGILGGTFWIIASSWLVYKILFTNRSGSKKIEIISFLVILIIPILVSVILRSQKVTTTDTIRVAIVQPNYEPHYVKRQIPIPEEIAHFLELSDQVITNETDYLIFPETSFSINLNNWNRSHTVRMLNAYLEDHPNLTLISGLETNKILQLNEIHDEYTRTYIRDRDTIYWENHNTAVRMAATKEWQLYYKSKLVPGAEFFPFKKSLFFLKPLMDKLGGSGSGLRKQEKRSAFEGVDGHRVAPLICYESVFGEFVSEYFDEGAEWIAVMTNDGWWDNTAGHRQHLGLSVIRAIEQRKWIARAANSGISCFIDPYGQVLQATQYNEEAAIFGDIEITSKRTIYSRLGDFIGRICLMLIAGAILYALMSKFYTRKNSI